MAAEQGFELFKIINIYQIIMSEKITRYNPDPHLNPHPTAAFNAQSGMRACSFREA